jgi:hypothetical protein
MMQFFNITLTGVSPLLMHADDVKWADRMKAWSDDPANKSVKVNGDDRTPAYKWVGYLYSDGDRVCIPADVIMVALREGGAMVPVPGGRSGKTFKTQSQSGILPEDLYWPLLASGKEVPMSAITALMQESSFPAHEKAVESMGFELLVKRAAVGTAKHIRVRPMFRQWSCSGVLAVQDPQITKTVLESILSYAGKYKGIGDWRPSAPKKPGTHGMFSAVVKEV